MPSSQNAKRNIFGGFFQSGSQKSKEELLEEEKRRQEALIEEQLKALCVDGAFLEEQKRQQENLVKAAAAKVKQKEEGETEEFDSQPRDCVDERKEKLDGADSAGGEASRINAHEALDTETGRPKQDLQNSPNSKLSALERRRQQRQKQGSKSGARRPNHHDATGGSGDVGGIDPGKRHGKQRLSQDQQLRSIIVEASSRQDFRSKTSDKDQTSHLVSPKKSASRPPMQPPIMENQPLADQKEADASLTFSNADALSTHLEKANKNTKRRRNRHGDEVSLGSKQLHQQGASHAKTNMLQEHLVDDSPTSKGNRPWESASAKKLLKAKLEERPPPEASNLSDDTFLDEDRSIFELSVFGLQDDGVSQSDEPRKGHADIDQDCVSDIVAERQAIETPVERRTLSEDVDNRKLDEGNSFDATWKESETDADFVNELKRLKAKTAVNTNNKSRSRQTKSTEKMLKKNKKG